MDVRKLGRWLGRLAAVTALGVGATLGTAAVAAADVDGSSSSGTETEVPSTSDGMSPEDASWENVSLLDASWE